MIKNLDSTPQVTMLDAQGLSNCSAIGSHFRRFYDAQQTLTSQHSNLSVRIMPRINLLFASFASALLLTATTANADNPPPTRTDVAYGEHPKQVMHFWRAESDDPTPLLFFIHGGGWQGGNRMNKHLLTMLPHLLKHGISAVSIEYRFIREAVTDGVEPPVKAPLHDAARALQFVRASAKEWNIDTERIAACGGSAGACSSLWLAFHDDLADADSDDPIARQSTRLLCAAVLGAQTTLDPKQMKAWTPNSRYGSHAFGIFKDNGKPFQQDFAQFLDRREEIMPWIREYSPYALVSEDDPPVYLYYSAKPGLGEDQKDPTHTSNFGVKLQEKLEKHGVPCELVYPDAPNIYHHTVEEYLTNALTKSSSK